MTCLFFHRGRSQVKLDCSEYFQRTPVARLPSGIFSLLRFIIDSPPCLQTKPPQVDQHKLEAAAGLMADPQARIPLSELKVAAAEDEPERLERQRQMRDTATGIEQSLPRTPAHRGQSQARRRAVQRVRGMQELQECRRLVLARKVEANKDRRVRRARALQRSTSAYAWASRSFQLLG